jgi:hypothetical protein
MLRIKNRSKQNKFKNFNFNFIKLFFFCVCTPYLGVIKISLYFLRK